MGVKERTAILALVGALSGVAACGGSGADSRTARPAPVSADCRQLLDLRAQVEAAFTGRDVTRPRRLLERYAHAGPKAIRGDLRVIADAYGKLTRALQAAEPATGEAADAAALDRLSDTVAGLDRQKVASANASVTSWVARHC
jgi:hypothetical protein